MTVKDLIIRRRELARKLRPLPPSPARTKLARLLALPNEELVDRLVNSYLKRTHGVALDDTELLPLSLATFDDDDDFFHFLTDLLKSTTGFR